MEDYHEAAEKQPYGEVKECRSYKGGKGHFVQLYSSKQIQADACTIVWLARDFAHFDISAYRLLIQRCNQGGCEAKDEAYKPHRVDPGHVYTGEQGLIRRRRDERAISGICELL
jgi:hypothetical protein